MSEALIFLAAPIAMSILLVGIHAYLGLHVLERDVIFVDISLSQVAALGAAMASLVPQLDSEGAGATGISLGLCLLVALALSLFRAFEKKISQEALIGITYALASGALILVMDRLPHGAEHLKEALIGNILFVTWPQVALVAGVYSAVGLIHVLFRKQFWASTHGQQKSLLWDFIFYFLFGTVITFSTHHAGVLVVFSILVVPAALATRFVGTLTARLFLAWGLGVLGILGAFFISYKWDLPAGAGIVATLTTGFFLVLIGGNIYDAIQARRSSATAL